MLACHCTLAGTKACENCSVYKSYYSMVKAETGNAPFTVLTPTYEIYLGNIPVAPHSKTLDNTTLSQAKDKISDLKVYGDGDMFKLLCKASSESEGWMKSTKAMEIAGVGCVVQVTTQQRNPDGSFSIDDAVTFVPGVCINENKDSEGKVIGRNLIKI